MTLRVCFHIALCTLTASCTPITDLRGHSDELADYSQIIAGQSTKDDVQAILGTPSAKSSFGDDTWYYIMEKRETYGMFAPEVTQQNVTAVRFDAAGLVADLTKTDQKDAKLVQYVEKTTPTEGRKLSIMEQLLGNFGKFSTPGRQIDPRALGR